MSTLELPFNAADLPEHPPYGAHPLLWELSRRLWLDHRPGTDSFCVACRPHELHPCTAAQLAERGLLTALRRQVPKAPLAARELPKRQRP